MQVNQSNLAVIRTGFKDLYEGAMTAAQPLYNQVAMEIPSTNAEEKYAWLKNVTVFREWLGERVLQNLSTGDFNIKNKDYENTVAIDRNAIEDDTVGVYKPMFEMMGAAAAMHPDSLVFPLLKNAFTSICFDGQYFIDVDHPVVDATGVVQSVSNSGGGSGSAWFLLDTTKPVKPIIFQKRKGYEFVAMDHADDTNAFMHKKYIYGVDARVNAGYGLWQLAYGSKQTLDATAYEAACTAMRSFTSDGGQPLNITPNLLVVGPSNMAAAKKILEAQTLANGASNTNYQTAKLLVSPYL